MSVMNKMLNDLDARGVNAEGEEAEYVEPPEKKRIKYMVIFIVAVSFTAVAYFTWRALGTDYFVNLYQQMAGMVSEKPTQKQPTKQVSVNQALNNMMPAKSGASSSESSSEQAATTEANNPVPQSQPVVEDSAPSQLPTSQSNGETASSETVTPPVNEAMGSDLPQNPQGTISEAQMMAEAVARNAEQEASQEAKQEPVQTTTSDVAVEQPSFVRFSDTENEETLMIELQSQAAQAMQQDNVSLAIRIFRQILEIQPEHHEARKKLSVLHYSNNENDDAIAVLQRGIEVTPERTDFRLMLARLYYRNKQLQQAYNVFDGIDPEVQRNIDFYGLKATVAQELQLNAEASHLYGKLVIFEPNRAQWWLGLAISLDRLEQKDGALRAYENAADLRQLSASADEFIRQRILELGG